MNEHLNWRYATKKFDPSKRLSQQELSELLETLRLSPSSFGLQPWKFIVLQNSELRKKLRPHAWDQSQITDADILIVFCVLKKMDENDVKRFVESMAKVRGISKESLQGYEQQMLGFLKSKNPEAVFQWMKNQVYIALGFFLNECAYRKIDACPMEGFDHKKFDEILDLSHDGLESVVLAAIGYRANDDHYAKLQKVRYSKDELFIEKL